MYDGTYAMQPAMMGISTVFDVLWTMGAYGTYAAVELPFFVS